MTEQKITVDVGAAIAAMEANPELAAKMNELAFGKVAADQLAAREGLIRRMGEALAILYGNIEASADLFEDGNNAEAWEWVMCARLAAKAPLAEYQEYIS